MRIVVLSDGLCGSLVSLAIRKQHPDHEFILIEVGEGFGRACFLPFCESAVPDCYRQLLEPLIARRWNSFYLSLREGANLIDGTIALLAPEQIRAELFDSIEPGQYVRTGKIAELGACHVVLEDGQRNDADYLIDARESKKRGTVAGNTKLTVRDYWLDKPHGLDVPVLLDATLTLPPHSKRFMQYVPLSRNLLRVSYARPEQDYSAKNPETMPFVSTGVRVVGEKHGWTSSQHASLDGTDSPIPCQPLPAFLDGQIISTFRTSAWDAVARLSADTH